jgi:hypothetical protein
MSNIQKQIAKIILSEPDLLQEDNTKHAGRHSRGHTVIHPNLEKWGAVAFTALCMLVSFESIVEHHAKDVYHGKREAQYASQIFSRSESKGETARLPEEFDIGLQTPRIAGL